MTTPQTIYALSSAPGRAGVAVIRVSGPSARTALKLMAAPLPNPREAAFRAVRHPETKELLDRAVVILFPAERSETGEDVAEFQTHGGRAVVRAVLGALATFPDCRLAEPGEFARQAFLNGKLDLTAAEGLADLVEAETEAQRRQALRQSSGQLAALYDRWRTKLVSALALTEAAIDFSDEADVPRRTMEAARIEIAPLQDEIRRHLDDGHRGEIVRDGFRVVLAGPPNVGKSSLLNALARRDVAIVSIEPGTTRDPLEVRLDLKGYPVIVTDTAGLRAAEGAVEREGIRRTLARAREADLVLWMMDAEHPDALLPPELVSRADQTLLVLNKVDLVPGDRTGTMPDDMMAISAKSGEGLAELSDRIAAIAADRIGECEAAVITQARHRQQLVLCRLALGDFLAGPSDEVELRAEDLRRAACALGRLTGRVDVEDILDEVFGRFCIGK